MTHLIHYIDKALGIAPLETTNHIDSVLSREYFLDKRRELVMGDGAGDQTFQGLVENEG